MSFVTARLAPKPQLAFATVSTRCIDTAESQGVTEVTHALAHTTSKPQAPRSFTFGRYYSSAFTSNYDKLLLIYVSFHRKGYEVEFFQQA